MSVAYKLKAIAQNEQRVFNSGYDKGVLDTLNTYPLGIEGTFVPNDDTKTFSISGLPFTPTFIAFICPSEVESSNRTPETLIYGIIPKGLYGGILYTDSSGGNRLGTVQSSSSVITWTEDGVTFTMPPKLASCFRTGRLYNYYITGGIE